MVSYSVSDFLDIVLSNELLDKGYEYDFENHSVTQLLRKKTMNLPETLDPFQLWKSCPDPLEKTLTFCNNCVQNPIIHVDSTSMESVPEFIQKVLLSIDFTTTDQQLFHLQQEGMFSFLPPWNTPESSFFQKKLLWETCEQIILQCSHFWCQKLPQESEKEFLERVISLFRFPDRS